jgi:hypothetical protein
MTTKEIILQIIKSVDIDADRVIYLNGTPYGESLNSAYAQKPSNKMLFDKLQGLLYSEFYAGIKIPANITANDYLTMQEETKHMNERLSKSNVSTTSTNPNWEIEQIDSLGVATAIKGNARRQLYNGEYLNETAFGRNAVVGEMVMIHNRKEFASADTSFYYVFGDTLLEDNTSMLVRFYFNINERGIDTLVQCISTYLNQYQIPFSFKCANHPIYFSRKDTAVLYIDKQYVNIFLKLLDLFFLQIEPYLLDEIPAFTKQINRGIAFAENPVRDDESFGTHCCKMITQGILSAYFKNAPKKDWLNEIKDTIEKKHHYSDYTVLFKNPHSFYPYHFN